MQFLSYLHNLSQYYVMQQSKFNHVTTKMPERKCPVCLQGCDLDLFSQTRIRNIKIPELEPEKTLIEFEFINRLILK